MSPDAIIFERHWKMTVVNTVPVVSIPIIFAVAIVVLAINYDQIPVELQVRTNPLYFLGVGLGFLLLSIYIVRRENYRTRHSPVIVDKTSVKIMRPKSVRFFFFGGSTNLRRSMVIAANPEEATLMEVWFFPNVQTLTIDTAAGQDTKAHHVRHVIDAARVSEAIFGE